MIVRTQSILPRLASSAAAAALLLACAGAYAQSCTFSTVGGAINFPPMDASSPVTVTAFTTMVVKCVPAGASPTWTFSGANGNAPLRMKHTTLNLFIPYSMAATFVSGSGSNETWRLTATVLGSNYQDAASGTYSDVLTATVTP